jgi:hypothetical protein
MTTHLPAFTTQRAADVVGAADLTPEAKALLRPEMPPGAYLDAVVAAGLHADAVKFLAHGLGRREAVWWACVCCRQAMEPAPPPEAVRALLSAETWCRAPTEENRRAAQAAAEAGSLEHPAALAALAAFLSGGTLAPAHVKEPVPPGPFLTARAVSGSVTLAAVRSQPEKAREKFAKFIEIGVAIAQPPAGAQGRAGR